MTDKKRPRFLRISSKERVFFAKRLSVLLRSGVPLMRAMEMLAGQASSKSAAYIYSGLVAHVARGRSLSSGIEHHQTHFGEFSVHIIRIGEAAGTLPENLDYLAEELKKGSALRKKVLGALVYPVVVVVATLAIALSLTLFIFPKIMPIFKSFHTALPLSTRILIATSAFLLQWGWLLILVIISSSIGAYLYVQKSPVARLTVDRALLKLPLFGTLAQYYNLASTCRTLGLLLKGDARLTTALSACAQSAHNSAYRTAFAHIADEVAHGQPLSTQLTDALLFPPIVRHMIETGEKTGTLSESLLYICAMYEEEIEDLTKNLATLIEPALMIVMGVVVGFIAISIITPIYGITQSMTAGH